MLKNNVMDPKENCTDKMQLMINILEFYSNMDLIHISKIIDNIVNTDPSLPIVFDLLCYDLCIITSNCTMSESAEYTELRQAL